MRHELWMKPCLSMANIHAGRTQDRLNMIYGGTHASTVVLDVGYILK